MKVQGQCCGCTCGLCYITDSSQTEQVQDLLLSPHSDLLLFPPLHPFLCSQKTTHSMRDMLETRRESWQSMCFSSCYLGIMRSILSKVNFIKSLLCLEWHVRMSQQTPTGLAQHETHCHRFQLTKASLSSPASMCPGKDIPEDFGGLFPHL